LEKIRRRKKFSTILFAFLVDSVLEGYNSSVFAYGATGAGKTHTMLGTEDKPGIMALTLEDLFTKINIYGSSTGNEYDVSLSYLEIYNENIRDLLSGRNDFLDLKEDPYKGVVVSGIVTVAAQSAKEVLSYLARGNRNRSSLATGANETSSRSHAILQVLVGLKSDGNYRSSKLSMIDLAGSERAAETYNRGMRMIEGANINKSLLALGNCINSLVDPTKKHPFVSCC
jgi:kinesin family member 18/19